MFSDPPSQSGDIIFFSPSSKKSANTLAQQLIRGRESRHSHVAIAVKQGNAIHAMPSDGVHLSRIRELLLINNHFSVYRNVDLSTDELCRLEDKLWYFNRQKYNFRFFMPSRRGASFCSELAAKAYRAVNVNISTRRPGATLPADIFDHISENAVWLDVTSLYRAFFLDENFDDGHDMASNFVQIIEQLNQNMAAGQQALIDRINYIHLKQGLPTPSISPTRKYWNITSKSRGIFKHFWKFRRRR